MVSQDEFLIIYRDTVARLYGLVAARSGGDRGLAEDVVQETYLRALSTWRRAGLPKEPVVWLNKVALNLLRTHFRSLSVRERHTRERDSHSDRSSPVDPESTAALGSALNELPTGQLQLLQGFHVEGKRVSARLVRSPLLSSKIGISYLNG